MRSSANGAANLPSVAPEEMQRVRPFMTLADRMGAFAAQLADGRTHAVGVRVYGPVVSAHAALLASSVVAGLLRPMLSSAVTVVNARAVAASRGIEIIESKSSRRRDFTNLLSVKVHTNQGERWIEGTVLEDGSPRISQMDGVDVEAPLEGSMLVIHNDDQPGVIGEVGTILGRHRINIASFALGRGSAGAIGLINLDAPVDDASAAVQEIGRIPAVKRATLASVSDVAV